MTAEECFYEAVICKEIAVTYETKGLVGNAHYFAQKAKWFVMKGLEALAFEASKEKLK